MAAQTSFGLLLLLGPIAAPEASAQVPARPASAGAPLGFGAPPPPPGTGLGAPSPSPWSSSSSSPWSTSPSPRGSVNGLPDTASPAADARLLGTDVKLLGADGRILGADGRIIYPPPLEQPLDPDLYRVDKGDVLQARLWGAQNFDLSLPVDPDGRLFIPRVGYVKAHGRTLTDVTAEIVRHLAGRFPRLGVAVTLATPRTFVVRVTGAVGAPGAGVAVNAFARASEAVARAGGVAGGGSQRRIELHHAAGPVETVDLLLFPLFGDRSRDPVLLDGDWLHVPLATRAVSVRGGVNRPGTYELLEGGFKELLSLAGGLSPEADDRLAIRIDSVDGEARKVQLVGFRAASPEAIALALRHHDTVSIPTLDEGAHIVVKGALGTQSDQNARVDPRVADNQAAAREITLSIPFVGGETVGGAIRKAGGLAPWADLGNAFVERRGDGARPTQRLPVDLVGLFTRSDRDKDVALEAGDTVYVPSMRTDVLVSGYVMKPGVYGYSLRLAPADYLALAGGETRDGARGRARVVSLDGQSRSLATTGRLQPGDSIVVPGKTLTTAEWVSISLGVISIGLSAVLLGYNLSR